MGWFVGWGESVGWWCRVVMRYSVFIVIVIIEGRCSYGHGHGSSNDRSVCSDRRSCRRGWLWSGLLLVLVLVLVLMRVLMFMLVQGLLVHVVLGCSLVTVKYCSEVVVVDS